MKLPVRQRPPDELPGLRAPIRVDRRTAALIRRLRAGDIAVIDHVDLDRDSAQAIVDAGAIALINAQPMISGRYPNLGPQVLAEAGLMVVDSVGAQAVAALHDGADARLDEGQLFVGEESQALGRVVDSELIAAEMQQAREGLASHLDSFSRNSVEFVRREEDLLIHAVGLPNLHTKLAGRPVVVVGKSPQAAAELAAAKRFLDEQDPVLIAVGGGAELLSAAGRKPQIVVIDHHTADGDLPNLKLLRSAKDVVVRADTGSAKPITERWERLGIRPKLCQTGAAPEDVALLLAGRGRPAVIVAAGLPATLEEFLDRRRHGIAGTYLARLKVGARLVDARSLPVLYSGRVRPRHLLLVSGAGLSAVAAAIGVTPVGQRWLAELQPHLQALLDNLQGLFS